MRRKKASHSAQNPGNHFLIFVSASTLKSLLDQKINQYGRTVARLTCDGVDANAEQVSRGMAWVYRRYAKDHNLFILEHEAKRFKRGLWADKSPTPPWQWRKASRYAVFHFINYV